MEDKALDHIMKKNWDYGNDMDSSIFFHVSREFNKDVEKCANEGCHLQMGNPYFLKFLELLCNIIK